MKRVALLLTSALLSSCGLVMRPFNRSSGDGSSSSASVKIDRQGNPFGGPTASLEMPGAGGKPGAPAAPATSATAGGVFDFSSAFSQGMTRGNMVNWRQSGSDAVQEARRFGKPMLILLSEPQVPTCVFLETMMGVNPAAAAAVQPRFVPLRVDVSDKRTMNSDYYRALKARLKPRGYPLLVVTLPDGTEVSRQQGYASESKYETDWQKRTLAWIEASHAQSEKAAAARRKRLESEGYRTWTNAQGLPVFAKLVKLDANQATFVSEWGEPYRTFTNRLSESDRLAIEKANASHQEMPQTR